MVKLVIVQGDSGSGKTTVSRYMAKTGFTRYGLDDYVDELRTHPGYPSKLPFRGIIGQVSERAYQAEFWDRFWRERGKLPYDMNSARNVVGRNLDRIVISERLDDEDRFHIAYALWNTFLTDRDQSLANGDVVLEILTDPVIRENNLRVNDDLEVERFIVILTAPREVTIRRKMEQYGLTRDQTERRMSFDLDLSVPDIEGLEVIRYRNDKPDDIEEIKQNLKERFF